MKVLRLLLGVLVLGCAQTAPPKASTEPPWGRLEVREVLLEPPRNWISAINCGANATSWRFKGLERDGIEALLREAGLTEDQRSRVLATTACVPQGGCILAPPDAVIGALSPVVRRELYARLARWPENEFAASPFVLPAEHRGWWADADELTPALRDQVRRMIYERDGLVFFSDMSLLCRMAGTESERVSVVRTFWRLTSKMVWLRLDANSDVERIAAWWEHRQRRKSSRAMLTSLLRPGEETLVDIVHLMPPMARRFLYTYPLPDAPNWDCGWTAANFFLERVDDRFLKPENVNAYLKNTDEVRWEDREFGDIVIFSTPEGSVGHMAIVLADNLLFTKNGFTKFQPWRIQTFEQLKNAYAWTPVIRLRRPR